MKIKETTIMLTGFQNDFCAKDGILYEKSKDLLVKNRTIENTVDLLKKTKGKGILIIFTPIVFTEDYRELGKNPVGILKAIKDAGAFKKGTKGAEIIDEFEPYLDQLTIIPGKRGLCSFGILKMDSVLKEYGIKNVVLGGLLTNVCVESTARAAYDMDYTVTVLGDCTACGSELEEKYSKESIFPMLGDVIDHNEFLRRLE